MDDKEFTVEEELKEEAIREMVESERQYDEEEDWLENAD